ncbi:MAG: methyltransferase domain-containing protein [Candidatus Dormibacteraeota bacterium]|nr:methyltransferase domain-containing protein [Candidatus Dormibacteraeota bacterium]
MDLTADQQTAMLADRYTQRAPVYDAMWSPIIRPAGERLIAHLPFSSRSSLVVDIGTGTGALLPAIQRSAPSAVVIGIDRSQGMLRLAKEKHSGPLALMDVQRLALPANRFEVAVVAFVLFHLPYPDQCLAEVNRVLQSGGAVGTVTWGAERMPPANAIWDEELHAAGAKVMDLPAVDNRACCDSNRKMTTLLGQAGFVTIRVWSESIEHRWRPEDHFDYQVRSTSRLLLQSLDVEDRETCLHRVRDRLSGADAEQYVYQGELIIATAIKADQPAANH